MLYGMPPFETKKRDAKETYDKIKRCDYSFSGHSAKIEVSSDAQNLISQILVLETSKRIPLE
jgi:serine/threonine protein kinase